MDLSGTWIQGTGQYEIKQTAVDDGVLKKGDFYLECQSAGTIAKFSDQAYGEWEFDMYNNNNNISIEFISIVPDVFGVSEQSGYLFQFIGGSQLTYLYRITSGSATNLFATASSFFEYNTWYRIKITRTLDGEFYVYIKGGDFGIDDWTLITISAGSNPVTDNTHVESQYFTIDIDSGDRIANIITRKAVQQ